MREKIAFPQLVELVAQKASTTSRMSELFVQEFFDTISQALNNGETVKIKGLGTFKVKKDKDGKDIQFIPDKDLAEAVNAPFAQFQPVELSDSITNEQLAEIDAGMEMNDKEQPQAALEQEPETKLEVEEAPQVATTPEPQPVEKEIAPVSKAVQEPEEPTPPPAVLESKGNSRKKLWLGIAAAIALIAIVAGIVSGLHSHNNSGATIADTVKTATTVPAIVTDTMRSDNRLHDMALKHYGDKTFWIYIYKENAKQFPDYRKIPIGSVLVIPDSSKYGINSDSKSSLRRAHSLSKELRKQFSDMEKAKEEEITASSDKKKGKEQKEENVTDTLEQETKHSRHHRHHRHR